MLTEAIPAKEEITRQSWRYVFVCVDGTPDSVKQMVQKATKKGLYLVAEKEVVAGYQKRDLPLLLLLDEKAVILSKIVGKNKVPTFSVH